MKRNLAKRSDTAMTADPADAAGVALWRRVADELERGIAEGRYTAGAKLPGEIEIAEHFRVNRHTVRRALAALAARGLVRAERGSGTYVETHALLIRSARGLAFPKLSAAADVPQADD